MLFKSAGEKGHCHPGKHHRHQDGNSSERRIILYKGAEPPGAFIRGVGWGTLERFHQNDFSLLEQEKNRQNKSLFLFGVGHLTRK